ncbi:hypothetical protein OGY10_01740, partial [Citrobacter sp. Cpo148]
NAGYAVSLKVQQHGLPTGIEVCGGQCRVHGPNIRPCMAAFPGCGLCGLPYKYSALSHSPHHRKHKAPVSYF